ncbi:MAG: hypothetical protein ACD_2C00038G0011 [uncultured bacterium (gcode 4)]|uniref:Uncharacterized protein n=1 Tax=uncultured bacterium (gcode 4) TaxID=1234023 RepID=K2GI83_9BACT|nr:MAG: hypothetical protein ACD_2C00038G0011 [uncultured bacterium (gcode 4)]
MTSDSQNNPLYRKADKQNMYATLVLLLTLAITFFLTSGLYADYTSSNEEKVSLNGRIDSLKAELDSLNKKKNQVSNDKATKDAIAQFASVYREDLILNQIYSKFDWILVHDISMDKWQKLPNGLSMASISINVDAKNIAELNKYLNFLTEETSNIRFVVKSLNLPLSTDNVNTNVSAGLSLWMYYFEQ